MKRKVAVFTGTRAEYGLLYWLMKDLQQAHDFELQVIASAMHFSPEFGETWRSITDDGFQIDGRIEMLLSSNTPVGVVKSMGLGLIGFADALGRLAPDMVIVLGDRFEALAMAQSALIMGIPIAHVHGGEITEGAYDDAIRHAITKMATWHFTAAEPYRQRVIQMGEHPATVFCVGALGLDHLTRGELMSRAELGKSLAFDLRDQYFLVTLHPETAGGSSPGASLEHLREALDGFTEMQVLATYPNADNGGRDIILGIERWASEEPGRVKAVPSLGFRRYLAALRGARAVIGNSSSGIIEAPAFGIPTVDIGERQKGRLCSASVIHCASNTDLIRNAVRLALDGEFRRQAAEASNPYGRGDAARAILKILRQPWPVRPKHFYDRQGVDA